MKKILIATALLLTATGMASAGGLRLYSGNYSADVLSRLGTHHVMSKSMSHERMPFDVDATRTASIVMPSGDAPGVHGNYAPDVTRFEINSGR